jgi:hypothetical protein
MRIHKVCNIVYRVVDYHPTAFSVRVLFDFRSEMEYCQTGQMGSWGDAAHRVNMLLGKMICPDTNLTTVESHLSVNNTILI